MDGTVKHMPNGGRESRIGALSYSEKPLPQFGINRINIYIVSAKTYIMEEQYETYRSD
jgi:hypothetical protein